MIKLNFIYSKEQDVSTVMNLTNDIDWIVKNKYNVILPGSFTINNLVNQKKRDIESVIFKEYDQKVYFNIEKELEDKWEKIDSFLEMGISKINENPLKEFNICLTKYGFVGAYELPNEVMINITSRTVEQIVASIAHEIIHLNIEPLIQKYKTGHWKKERIVDLIFIKILPEIMKKKEVPVNTEKIDEIFESNFPNIEKVLSLLV